MNQGEKLILFVGRLTQQKGCEYLIRAIPQISKQFNVKLVVVGDGSYRGELETLAKTVNGQKILFTGFLPDDDLSELFLCADVMAIPSIYEPFGVVALEAMAAGLPVVASNVDGLGEVIVHEKNGILVFPKDRLLLGVGNFDNPFRSDQYEKIDRKREERHSSKIHMGCGRRPHLGCILQGDSIIVQVRLE